MYVASVPNRNSPPAILLRESYRENGKVKTRTLANLSHWPADKIELFRQLLKHKGAAPLTTFDIQRSLPYGHVAAVVGVMKDLGLDKVLCSRRSRERDLCMAMIAARVVDASSKASTAAGLCAATARTALGQLLDLGDAVTPDELYAAMDWLGRRQSYIEKKLAKAHLEAGSLVLYDLTSVWMEGSKCELSKHGYSRDSRPQKPQIEFGLLTDSEGRPIAVQVFDGNIADPSTVPAAVGKLREKFGLSKVVLVGDRGMLTSARIREDLRPAGLDFVSALRKGSIRKLVNNGEIQLSLFDEKDLVEIRSDEFPGERLVVCRNPFQADEIRRRRNKRVGKAFARLVDIRTATLRERRPLRGQTKIALRVGEALGKSKGLKRYFKLVITEDCLEVSIDHEAIETDAALDGLYVIRTSVDEDELDTNDVVRTYKSLERVERAFRSMKSIDLDVRPVFHHRSDRVRAHVLLCMLAYYVKFELEKRLAPLLFVEEDRAAVEASRASVVRKAEPSKAAKTKTSKRLNEQGLPVQSLRALLGDLATMTHNHVVPHGAITEGFWLTAAPTELHTRVFELLDIDPVAGR